MSSPRESKHSLAWSRAPHLCAHRSNDSIFDLCRCRPGAKSDAQVRISFDTVGGRKPWKEIKICFLCFVQSHVCSSNISSTSSLLKIDVMIRNHDLRESGLFLCVDFDHFKNQTCSAQLHSEKHAADCAHVCYTDVLCRGLCGLTCRLFEGHLVIFSIKSSRF